MTLKYGFLGLPQGGAKAGIRFDPEAPADERRRRLAAFGRAIEPFLRQGLYHPGSDMGTRNEDIRYLLESLKIPVPKRELRCSQSGYYTALTVFESAKQAAHASGLDFSRARIAIEGFGSVGRPLAELFAAAGIPIVAVSTSRGAIYHPEGLPMQKVFELADRFGSHFVNHYKNAERIDLFHLPELPVEILCPCARHATLHQGNAARVQARMISAGANNPVTPEADRLFFEKGVLCLPDFVTNSGGVLGGTMEFTAMTRNQIRHFIEQYFGPCVGRIIRQANDQKKLPSEVARDFALRRFRKIRQSAEKPTLTGRFFKAGLSLYRHGFVPGPLVGSLSPAYFKRNFS